MNVLATAHRSVLALILVASFLAMGSPATAQQQPMRPPVLDPTSNPPLPAGTTTQQQNSSGPGPTLVQGTWNPLGPASLATGIGNVSGRQAGIAVDPTNDNTIYVAAAGGGVWRTTDGGATWSPLTDTQSTLAMGAIAVAPTNNQMIYAGTGEGNNSADSNFGRGILVSSNGGASWTLSTGAGHLDRLAVGKISVDPTNAAIAYAAVNDLAFNGLGGNAGIYKTTDSGITWTNVTAANGQDSSTSWSDVVVDPNTPTTIYAAHGDIFGATANGVYRSLNSGGTWTLLGNAPSGAAVGRIALAIAPSATTNGSHVLYVAVAQTTGAGGNLAFFERSDNADAATPTFSNLTAGNPTNLGGQGWYNLIVGVDPGNSAIVYLGGSTNSSGFGVERSTNSGASWASIQSVGGVSPHTDNHAMAFDSTNRMLLGTDGGIWRYAPTVPSWTNLNANLNTIQFTGIDLHPSSTTVAIGGSQDNGTEEYNNNTVWTETVGGDGGFAKISHTLTTRHYHTFTDVTFERSDSSGATGTWVSKNAGLSGSSNFYAPYTLDPANGDHILFGSDHVFESTTAGDSWTAIGTPGIGGFNPSANVVDSVAIVPGNNVRYAATGGYFASSSQIWMTANDGASWTQHSLPVGGKVNQLAVDPNDSSGNTVVAVISTFNGASGQVYRTINGGTSWTNISGNLPQVPVWSAQVDIDTNKTIYVSTESQVYTSTSPFTTWTVYGTGLPNVQGVELVLNTTTRELALASHGRGAWATLVPPLCPTATVTNVTSTTANGTYGVGAVITITISFSTTVNVTGTPQLALNSGGTANYTSGSGTSTLTFTYTVAAGQNSAHLDYTSTGALTLNGGTIKDTCGSNAATLTLAAPGAAGSLGANKSIVIDTVLPTVVSWSVVFGSAPETYNLIGSSRIRVPWDITAIKVVFSKPIASGDSASLTGLSVTGFSGLGTNTLTWTITAVPIGSFSTSLLGTTADAIQDAAGNPITTFNQNFKVLWGDFVDDGVVNSQDTVGINLQRSQPYNIFADMNGDGVVDINDINVVRSRLGTSQP